MWSLRIVSLSGMALAAALLSGCGGGGGGSPRGQGAVKVAFISNNPFEFWKIAQRGTDKAAAELGVEVEFRMPPNGTSEEQRRIIEDLRNKGVQGIAISPNDAENQSAFLKEVNATIPIITQDSDVPDPSARRCYIGTNNVLAGVAAGEMVKEAVPDGGKIVIYVGKLDAQNAVERRRGVVTSLAGGEDKCQAELKQLDAGKYPVKFGKYELLDTRTDGGDQAVCRSNADDTLVKHADVKCLVGLWAYNPPAMLEAVKNARKQGKVVLVGFDENEETLQGIKDGHVYGTVVQNPFMFGYEAVKILAGLAKGNAATLQRPDIDSDKRIFVKHRVITKEQPKFTKDSKGHPWVNVEEFHTELKKLKGS
jgi:ribose transport system substrate-binding protein